jgi:hypothetical protein
MIWPFVVILGLVGPHTLGTLGAAARGLQKSPYRLIEQGPLASYYVWGDYGPAGRAPDRPPAERRDQAAAYIANKLANEVVPDEAGQYIMLADGIALLRKIPDIEQRGIVPNGRMFEFSVALEARPVAAFPVWPTRVSPALQDITPFGAEVDVVMITRTPNIADWAMVSDLLLVKMGGQYAPCHQSLIWTLYARQDAGISGCAISP